MPILLTMLITVLATKAQHPYLGAFIMILMGAVLLLGCFQQYREYRILADAPRARVRSIPMGLVHLEGKATGDPLTSPLTGMRCFCFITNIEAKTRTRTKGGGTAWQWQTVVGDDDFREFYLDDGTGRVLVKSIVAEQTEFYMQRTFYCEIGEDGHFQSVRPVPGIPPPSEQAVWTYIHGRHSRKLFEHAGLFEGEEGRIRKLVMESAAKVMNVQQQLGSLSLDGSAGPVPGGGPYRVSEECFLADSDTVIVGTCAENPDPKNDEDRNLIHKGENEKTFLVSTKGEKSIGKTLRVNAFIMLFLGGTLIVGGFALALHSGGLL